jgi:hypothetical protein
MAGRHDMSDYEKHLEAQNEELRQKLAATQKELEETKFKLKRYTINFNKNLNDLVSVQPMMEPAGGYSKASKTISKIRLLAS